MHVTICPEGSNIPWAGAVCIRCEPAGELYRVGLAFTRESGVRRIDRVQMFRSQMRRWMGERLHVF